MSEDNKNALVALAVFIILILLYLAIASLGGNDDKKTASDNINAPEQSVVVQNKPLSEEEQIKQLVSSKFKGLNNLKKEYIRSIKVAEQIDGGWGVFVEYNADDVMSADSTKKSIYLDMSKMYTALYTSKKDVRTVSVAAYFPGTDKHGNTSDSLVYKTMLEKTEADKVNWGTDSSYLGLEILPKVWEIVSATQDFRK